jgi:hypothetical protein
MQIETDDDFSKLQDQFMQWRRQFPMFSHDVREIEKNINQHVQTHSRIMVDYRRTHNKTYLEKAQLEIDAINRILNTVSKLELVALLSQR